MSTLIDAACWASARLEPTAASLDVAKRAYRDVMACMIGGRLDGATTAVARASHGAHGKSTSVAGTMLEPSWAALVNGTASHALDFDDNFSPAFTHASAVAIPALLAIVEDRALGAGDLLQAFVIALELQAWVGNLVQPEHYFIGWHATNTVGVIGTAGACACLLGLGSEQVAQAMSIATSMASGSKNQFGTHMKPIHAGLAARNAVLSSRLAEVGVRGSDNPFVGDCNFVDLFSTQSDRAFANVGSEPLAIVEGLTFKRFASCAAGHKTLDAIVELRPCVDLNSITQIETVVTPEIRQNLPFDLPTSERDAKFCLPYCIAVLLLTGELGPDKFTDFWLTHPQVATLMKSVTLTVIPGANTLGSPVVTQIKLLDGTVHARTVNHVVGSPPLPLSDQDVRSKIRQCCAAGALDPDQVWHAVENILVADDVGDALRHFRASLLSSSPTGIERTINA